MPIDRSPPSKSIRTYKVNYTAAKKAIHDPEPHILYLGTWTSPKGNTLICGINLKYLTTPLKGELEAYLEAIFSETSTQDRVRSLRYFVRTVFDTAYRTWNIDQISNVTKGEIILTPDAARREADREYRFLVSPELEPGAPPPKPAPPSEPEVPPEPEAELPAEPEVPVEPEAEEPPTALPAPAPSPIIKPGAPRPKPAPPEPEPRPGLASSKRKPTPEATTEQPPAAPGFKAPTSAQKRRGGIKGAIEAGKTPVGPVKPAPKPKTETAPATAPAPVIKPTSAQRAAKKGADAARDIRGTDNLGPQARGLIDPKKP